MTYHAQGLGTSPRAYASSAAQFVAVIAAHITLAVATNAVGSLATLHAVGTLMLGLWGAARWTSASVIAVGAYVAGAEVYWRMNGASVPWEFGKYAIVLIFALRMLRLRGGMGLPVLPLAFFVFLVPSTVVRLTDQRVTLGQAISAVSFNLSGPLCLATAAMLASQATLCRTQMRHVLEAVVASTALVLTHTVLSTVTADAISFTNESNFVTSGGFGPNQVSVVLGLGLLAALLITLDIQTPNLTRLATLTMAVAFGTQAALTLSRGGLYATAGALMVALPSLLRDRRTRRLVVSASAVMVVLATTVVVPRLDSFTDGALTTRFQNREPSHRGEIVREDIRLWRAHFWLGLGPGGARAERQVSTSMSHTEFSRMLSEHGFSGLLSLTALGLMTIAAYRKSSDHRDRAIRMALIVWSLLSITHAGMRLAAFGFIFGVACARRLHTSDTVAATSTAHLRGPTPRARLRFGRRG